MKNKTLILVAVLLLNVLAIYMVVSSIMTGDTEYNDALALARKYAEDNLCAKAMAQYEEVLDIKDTIEARIEMITVFQKGLENGEFTNKYSISKQVLAIVDAHREELQAYEYAADYFYNVGSYEDCVVVLKDAEHNKIRSDKLNEITDKVKTKYNLAFSMFTEVKPMLDGIYAVKDGELYRYVNSNVSSVVGSDFVYASSFSEKLAFVKKDGYTYIVDTSGVRQAYLKDSIERSSGVGAGLLSCYEDKVYKYYDTTGEYKFGKYEFAGRFRNGVAAVKEGKNEWYLIDPNGDKIVDTKFKDVILNEYDDCAAKGIIFAKEKDKYKMYDTNMEQIGDFECDDACLFVSDGYAAFEDNGKWGFVDSKGEIVIKPQFDEAKSFSNGFAGVRKGDTWSFIDVEGNIIIEGNFEDVDYMNDKGTCFVKVDGYWKYITLYYFK